MASTRAVSDCTGLSTLCCTLDMPGLLSSQVSPQCGTICVDAMTSPSPGCLTSMATAVLQAQDVRRDDMVQMTIEVPEALAERLAAVQERLPEVLAHGLDILSPLPNGT